MILLFNVLPPSDCKGYEGGDGVRSVFVTAVVWQTGPAPEFAWHE